MTLYFQHISFSLFFYSPLEREGGSQERSEPSWNMATRTGSAFRKFWGYTQPFSGSLSHLKGRQQKTTHFWSTGLPGTFILLFQHQRWGHSQYCLIFFLPCSLSCIQLLKITKLLFIGHNDSSFSLPLLSPLPLMERLLAHFQSAHLLFQDLGSVTLYRGDYRGECVPIKSLIKKASAMHQVVSAKGSTLEILSEDCWSLVYSNQIFFAHSQPRRTEYC